MDDRPFPKPARKIAAQLAFDAFEPALRLPEGMVYRPELIDRGMEASLVRHIKALDLRPFAFHGFEAKRRTCSFGWTYRFDGSGLAKSEPIPDWLLEPRRRAAELANLPPEAFEHVLLIEYAVGAGLGWHRDRPVFGDVAGISLLSPAPLRFRRKQDQGWERITLEPARRSAYLLRGPARDDYEHSIPPVASLRYSITFRTLRRLKRKGAPEKKRVA